MLQVVWTSAATPDRNPSRLVDRCSSLRRVGQALIVQHAVYRQLAEHDHLSQDEHFFALGTVNRIGEFTSHVTGRGQGFRCLDEQRFVIHGGVDEVDLAGVARGNRNLVRPGTEVEVDGAIGSVFDVLRFERGVVGDWIGVWRVRRNFEYS